MFHKISKIKTLTTLLAFVVAATNLCASDDDADTTSRYRSDRRSNSKAESDYVDEPAALPRRFKSDSKSNLDRKNNTFAVYGFYGRTLSDSDIDYYGCALEYRRTLLDGRCDSCGYGNRLELVARIGGSAGYDDYNSLKLNEMDMFLEIGPMWELQIFKNVSLVISASIGPRYIDYYIKYRGDKVDDDDMLGLGYAGTVGINFACGPYVSLEIGVDYRGMFTSNLNSLSAEELSYIAGRIGISAHF